MSSILQRWRNAHPAEDSKEQTVAQETRARQLPVEQNSPLLWLPNELLIIIFDDVISCVRPHATIRDFILKLSRVCRRFYDALQFLIDSKCVLCVSIPNTKIPEISTRYRLVEYNTDGARGPFVKRLEIYGGIRIKCQSSSDTKADDLSLEDTFNKFRVGLGRSEAQKFVVYQAAVDRAVTTFANLTHASFQNGSDSLMVHLIYGIRMTLAHCPSLRNLTLLLNFAIETEEQFIAFSKALDQPMETEVRLQELKVTINHVYDNTVVPSKVASDPAAKPTCWPLEICTKMLGSSTRTAGKVELFYDDEYKSGYTDNPPAVRWKFSNLRHFKVPTTSLQSMWAVATYFDIDYDQVQELTLIGEANEKLMPWDPKILEFYSRFHNVKVLNMNISSKGDTKWVVCLLKDRPPSLFPQLAECRICVTWNGYVYTGRDSSDSLSALILNLRAKHENEIIKSSTNQDTFRFLLK
ncbi:hypothetical protein H072_6157 [Dactylellina haptotyla CBS 200.50]|uniref:F-box domain-containing protein n=1 Tax=Dactylellina haptotyla (strain CBS 200.50) TaxID=1284197 RepID=S8AAR2_DACHA|nr:hypothetical protein H072_6157 [Dactylellina haptotyla CBS 200.50]